MNTYANLKNLITKKMFTKEEAEERIELFYLVKKLDDTQYFELMGLAEGLK